MLKNYFFLLLFIVAGVSPATAQPQKIAVPNVVKWEFSYDTVPGTPDELILKLTAKIDNGWHLYSQQVDDGGPVPTTFKFTADEKNYQLIGTTSEPAGETHHDETFEMEIKSFTEVAVFTQNIRRTSKEPLTISGEVEFMTCNNVQCLPPKSVAFSISIP